MRVRARASGIAGRSRAAAAGAAVAGALVLGIVTSHGPAAAVSSPFVAPSRLLQVDERSRAVREGGVIVRDLTFAAETPSRGRIEAYLVSPPGDGPFAGILYFHWLGERRSDRTQFLDEAVALAPRGAVSLLVQGYFPWKEAPTGGAADRLRVIEQVIDTRRAMDLLVARPEVDRHRLAFVGHDYGAMYGAILAGVDRRPRAYVLMAGMGSFADWSLKYWPATGAGGEAAYRRAIADVDPIHYIGLAAPASLLFQFARRDAYVTEAAAAEFFDQASHPREWRWYDAAHDLDVQAAAEDRRAWLAGQLALTP